MPSTKLFLGSILISLGFVSSRTSASAQDARVMQLAKLEIDSSQLESYSQFLKTGIRTAMQAEPGVLMLYAVADKKNPTHITILEIYADSNAYHAHLRTSHFLKYKSATAGMVKRLELIPVSPLIQDMKIEARDR